MKKQTLLIIAATLAVSSLAGCDQKEAPANDIAVVNIAQVLRDSQAGKQEAEHDKQVQALLLNVYDDASSKYARLPAAGQQKSRDADADTLNNQWRAEKNAARQVSLNAITKVVDAYRQEKKLRLVIDSQTVISRDDNADITADIISRLDQTEVDYGPLPVISVKTPAEAPVKPETPKTRKTHK